MALWCYAVLDSAGQTTPSLLMDVISRPSKETTESVPNEEKRTSMRILRNFGKTNYSHQLLEASFPFLTQSRSRSQTPSTCPVIFPLSLHTIPNYSTAEDRERDEENPGKHSKENLTTLIWFRCLQSANRLLEDFGGIQVRLSYYLSDITSWFYLELVRSY